MKINAKQWKLPIIIGLMALAGTSYASDFYGFTMPPNPMYFMGGERQLPSEMKFEKPTPHVQQVADGVYEEFDEYERKLKTVTYAKGVRHGLLKEYHANGSLRKEAEYVEGYPMGVIKEFYMDGQVYQERTYGVDHQPERITVYYENGKESAILDRSGFTGFYPDGSVKEKCSFNDWTINGEYVQFHPNGTRAFVANYEDGKIVGTSREYDANGNLKAEFEMSQPAAGPTDDTELLLAKHYYENGSIMKKAVYQNYQPKLINYDPAGGTVQALQEQIFDQWGNSNRNFHMIQPPLNGKYAEYYPNGQKKYEVEFDQNKPVGTFKGYYETGQPQWIQTYKDGQLDGLLASYNPDGTPIREYQYRQGIPDQDQGAPLPAYRSNGTVANEVKKTGENSYLDIFHDADGRILRETPYVKGQEHGLAKAYFPNGTLYLEIPYENGEQNGTVKMYYPTGELFNEYHLTGGTINSERAYLTTGEVFSEISYHDNNLPKVQKLFDKKGNLTQEITYEAGAVANQRNFPNYLSTLDRNKCKVELKSVTPDPNVPLRPGDDVEFTMTFAYSLEEPEAKVIVYVGIYPEGDDYIKMDVPFGIIVWSANFPKNTEEWSELVKQGAGEVTIKRSIKIPDTTELTLDYGIYGIAQVNADVWETIKYKIQDPQPTTQEKQELFPNGKVMTTSMYLNGQKHGLERHYDSDGKLTKELEFQDGKVNGIVRKFHQNGRVAFELFTDADGYLQKSLKTYGSDGRLGRDLTIDAEKNVVETVFEEDEKKSIIYRQYSQLPRFEMTWLQDGLPRNFYGIIRTKIYGPDGALLSDTFSGSPPEPNAYYVMYKYDTAEFRKSLYADMQYSDDFKRLKAAKASP